jgi:hypothetical protein
MSISFSVAAAGLITAFFIPDRFRSNPAEMIIGLHEAILVLGGFTIFSTLIFCELTNDDGAICGEIRPMRKECEETANFLPMTLAEHQTWMKKGTHPRLQSE